MSEYWKSTPKKFCDFCKCWIADNKPSVDFHEKGKNHQANVKRRLAEIKTKSAKKRKQEENFQNDFAAIEAAALKAVQKDLKTDPTAVGQSDMRAVVAASNASIKISEAKEENTVEEPIWTECQAPTGHTYYYNRITGVSTWEIPKELQELKTSNAEGFNEAESTSKQEQVEPPRDCHPLLGGWTTVASYQPKENSVTEKKSEVDRSELNSSAQQREKEGTSEKKAESTTPSESIRVKFKEKTLKVPLADDTQPPVSFKKRKVGQNRSIRRRDDDEV